MARGLSVLSIRMLAVIFAGGVVSASAQTLRDPTRPPISAGQARTAGMPVATGWVLQSVLISPDRRYAVINGQVVAPGESVSGAQLVAVAENRVTLRTREGIKTLQLFPGIAKVGAGQATSGTVKQQADSPAAQSESNHSESGNSGVNK